MYDEAEDEIQKAVPHQSVERKELTPRRNPPRYDPKLKRFVKPKCIKKPKVSDDSDCDCVGPSHKNGCKHWVLPW